MNKIRILSIPLLLLFPSLVSSAVIHVPGDQPTIQAGIDAAVNGDTVLVADGTYRGWGNKDLDFNGKEIAVKSEHGPENCIIDCENNGRGFSFHNGEGKNSVVDGFTIQNGHTAGLGGGIYCWESSPTIINNIISECWAYYKGGGMAFWYSNSIISDNNISGNTAGGPDAEGGGIWCSDSLTTILNNIITGNTADLLGGGIFCHRGSPTIKNNSITWNSTGIYGGGICCRNGSSLKIENNVISLNWSYDDGGGISCNNCFLLIQKNIISDNESFNYGGGINCYDSNGSITHNIIIKNTAAWGDGGGIIFRGTDTPAVTNNLIAQNTAEFGGGGIYSFSNIMIANNSIINNIAWGNGGGISCIDTSLIEVKNSILWNNYAPSGKEIYIGYYFDPTTFSISYSDVEGGQDSVYVDTNCTLNWGDGMIDADPLFVKGPLGKYYLSQIAAGQSQDSPCVDAGDRAVQWPCHLQMVCGTTRTDVEPDTAIIDMGYHYPLVGIKIPPGHSLEEVPGEKGGRPPFLSNYLELINCPKNSF